MGQAVPSPRRYIPGKLGMKHWDDDKSNATLRSFVYTTTTTIGSDDMVMYMNYFVFLGTQNSPTPKHFVLVDIGGHWRSYCTDQSTVF